MPTVKPVGKVGRHPVYVTKGGFKIGQTGKAIPPGTLYGQVTKGQARKIRKEAFKRGLIAHASAVRSYIPPPEERLLKTSVSWEDVKVAIAKPQKKTSK